MYLTFSEYEEYGGALDQTAFEVLEFKARKRIDYLTANRVRDHMEEISEAVKRCVFSIVEIENAIGIEAQATHPSVTSYSTDGYSETYGNSIRAEDAGKRMNDIIRSSLYGELDDNGVPLLYTGVRG